MSKTKHTHLTRETCSICGWNTAEVDETLDALINDCGPLSHLSEGDAPALCIHYIENDLPGDIHHPNFGKHLKAEMDKVGIECITRMNTDYSDVGKGFDEEALAFLKRHFRL